MLIIIIVYLIILNTFLLSNQMAFTVNDRAKVAGWFDWTESIEDVQKRFKREFKRDPPDEAAIRKWHSAFMQTGNVLDGEAAAIIENVSIVFKECYYREVIIIFMSSDRSVCGQQLFSVFQAEHHFTFPMDKLHDHILVMIFRKIRTESNLYSIGTNFSSMASFGIYTIAMVSSSNSIRIQC